MQEHRETCPDRINYERSLIEIEINTDCPKKEEVKAEVIPPGYIEDENWDELVGTAGYNPEEAIKDKPILRKIHGATLKEKRKFYAEEKKRFERILGEPIDPLPKGAVRVKKEKPPKIKRERDPDEDPEDGEILESSESEVEKEDEYEIVFIKNEPKLEPLSDEENYRSKSSPLSDEEVLPVWEPIGPREIVIDYESDEDKGKDDFLDAFIQRAEHKREKLNPKRAKELKKEAEKQKKSAKSGPAPVKPTELPAELRGSLVANPLNYHWRNKASTISSAKPPKATKHPLDRLTSRSPIPLYGPKEIVLDSDNESVDSFGRVRRLKNSKRRESTDSFGRLRRRSVSTARSSSSERRRRLRSSRSPTGSVSSLIRRRSDSKERKKHKKDKKHKKRKEKAQKIKRERISPPPVPAVKSEKVNLEEEDDQLQVLDDLDDVLDSLLNDEPAIEPPKEQKPVINPFSIKPRKQPNLLSLDHIKREFCSPGPIDEEDSLPRRTMSMNLNPNLIKVEPVASDAYDEMMSSLNKSIAIGHDGDRLSTDSQHSSLRENSYEGNILAFGQRKRSSSREAIERQSRKKQRSTSEEDDRKAREDSEERYLQAKLRQLERIRDCEEGYENLLREIQEQDHRRKRERAEDFF